MSKIIPRLDAITSILADTYAPQEKKSLWYCDNLLCDGKAHDGWDHPHCRANQRPPESDWFVWLLLSGRGFGKMLALDTPIPTPSGWTTMGDIHVGDIVFDEDGNQCNVTNVFNVETPERAYLLHFSDHTSIMAGGEHEWVTWTHPDRKAYSRCITTDNTVLPKSWPTWRSLRGHGPRSRTTDEIATTLNHGDGQRWRNHSIPVAEPLQINQTNLPLDPYTLGAWLGDGNSNNGQLTGIDPGVWERIEDAGFTISHHADGYHRNIQGLLPILRSMELIYNKHIPDQYMRSSVDQRTALLQGLMDTDGTISDRGSASFASSKIDLANQVLELVRSLGEKPVLRVADATCNGINYGPSWNVAWHPTSVSPVWLQRKRDRLRPLGAAAMRRLHRYITDAELVDPIPMRCITVDSPNHMYLAGEGMIPTHNSRTAAEWLIREANRHPNTEWAVVAPTGFDSRKCAEDLNVGIMNIAPQGILRDNHPYNRTLGDIYLKNKSIIHLVSADKPDRLRGFNLSGCWADELSSWRYPDTWDLGLLPTLRDQRVDPRIVVTTTPKPVTLLRRLVEEPNDRGSIVITRGSTFDNADNLAPRFLDEMRARYEGTRRGRQELYGELLTDVEGALVSQDMIDGPRLRDLPEIHMVRIVVAVDPATTSGENADETGIIVCAKGIDNRGYILADLSCKESPDGWARIVAAAYDKYGADRVIAEKNQGGDMVERIVRSVHPNIAYKGVIAKVGKKLRAEPIAALYEQGKVSHVGYFEALEDQWTTWIPDAGTSQKSPDRVDALVHGLTELGLIGLPGVHVSSWLEAEHPSCQVCSTPAPKGTLKCPKCGADRPETNDPPPAADEPWSLTSSMNPNGLAPNPQVEAVQRMLQEINPQQGWNRWRR